MSQYVKGKRTVAWEQVSEAKILSDLRAAAEELGEPLSIKRYRRQAPLRGWVSDFTVAHRFGSWAGACEVVGIRSNPPSGRRAGSRFGERECLRALRRCSKELGGSPTLVGYVRWSGEQPDEPKAATIRYHLGGWNAALRAAGLALNKHSGADRHRRSREQVED